MFRSKQKEKEIHDEIMQYYDFAEKLIEQVENSSHDFSESQFAIVEEVVEVLHGCADQLSLDYINVLKNGESKQVSDSIRESFNKISVKIEECKNKILMLYQEV